MSCYVDQLPLTVTRTSQITATTRK